MRKHFLWLLFFCFVATALLSGWYSGSLQLLRGPYIPARIFVFALFVGFVAYSMYCSAHENLLTTVKKIGRFHWGRQIGLDLYIGLGLSVSVIYLNEGSVLAAILWLAPIILFGNLATLLYVAIHFESLVAHFAS